MTAVNTMVARTVRLPQAKIQSPYSHIVVALDGSRLAEQVLAYVEPLAKAFGSTVTCVCAVEPVSSTVLAETSLSLGYVPVAPLYEAEQDVKRRDKTYLAGIRRRLAGKGFEVHCEEPVAGAAEAIVASARRNRADLIAMTTHGRSGLGRALLGSVADEVVRTAHCPLLLVRLTEQS